MKRTINHTIIFSIFLIFLFACPAFGATYYVKAGGNDSLDGLSDATAWVTIAKVNATIKSGDTVYFRSQDTWSSASSVLTAKAGVTYDGSTYGSGSRAKLKATSGGSSVVTIEASNVTFRGFDVDANKQQLEGISIGTHSSTDVSGITIDNCVVHDVGLTDAWMYGILVTNSLGHKVSNVSILNTTVYNTIHEGIAVYAAWANANDRNDTILIRNCTVYNTGLTRDGAGVGVEICNDSDNVTVEYCNLNRNHYGVMIRVSPPSEGSVTSGPENMIIRNNLIHDNIIAGIVQSNPRNLTMSGSIYGNLIYNNGKTWTSNYGFDLYLAGDANPSSIFNIYNNTFYSTTNECSTRYVVTIAQWASSKPSTTINFKNNIVYAGDYVPIYDRYSVMSHSNNLIYRSSGSSATHVISPLGTAYNRSGVLVWEATAKNTDPAFTGGPLPSGFTGTYGSNMVPNTNYFAITSGAALDSGATLGSIYNSCINGAGLATRITRPQGVAYDIGAYEYTGSLPEILVPPTNLRIIHNQ